MPRANAHARKSKANEAQASFSLPVERPKALTAWQNPEPRMVWNTIFADDPAWRHLTFEQAMAHPMLSRAIHHASLDRQRALDNPQPPKQ